MKTVKIDCDACSRDLTYTGNCVDYRLVLESERMSVHPDPDMGYVTSAGRYPAVERTFYFCGLSCLDNWRDRERHSKQLWRAFFDEWKQAKGTKAPDGAVYSYPDIPHELRVAKNAEFAAAALAAFP